MAGLASPLSRRVLNASITTGCLFLILTVSHCDASGNKPGGTVSPKKTNQGAAPALGGQHQQPTGTGRSLAQVETVPSPVVVAGSCSFFSGGVPVVGRSYRAYNQWAASVKLELRDEDSIQINILEGLHLFCCLFFAPSSLLQTNSQPDLLCGFSSKTRFVSHMLMAPGKPHFPRERCRISTPWMSCDVMNSKKCFRLCRTDCVCRGHYIVSWCYRRTYREFGVTA